MLGTKLFQNGMWLFILQIFNTVVPLLTLPYITRVLGTSNYGVFSLSLNWVTYFQVIVEYGFGLREQERYLSKEMIIYKTYIVE